MLEHKLKDTKLKLAKEIKAPAIEELLTDPKRNSEADMKRLRTGYWSGAMDMKAWLALRAGSCEHAEHFNNFGTKSLALEGWFDKTNEKDLDDNPEKMDTVYRCVYGHLLGRPLSFKEVITVEEYFAQNWNKGGV